MSSVLRGIVHGKTIELEEDPGVAEGQKVEVYVTILGSGQKLPGPPPGWHPGSTKTAAGLLADFCTEEDDRILEEIYKDRKRERSREATE